MIFSVGLLSILMIFSFWVSLPLPKMLTFNLPFTSSKSGISKGLNLKW